MHKWFLAPCLALALLAVAGRVGAVPLDPALQQQLLDIYGNYNKAIAAGQLDAAIALRSQKARKEAKSEFKTAKQRREALTMLQAMIPTAINPVHAKINRKGDQASIQTVTTAVMPPGDTTPGAPPPGSTVHDGLELDFVKEAGAWKLDDLLFGADPTAVTACKDETNEPEAAYDPDKDVSAGGPIVRVDFQPGYTLIVFSVVGDGTCAFLPSKDELTRHGVDTAKLVPFAVISMEGIAHRSDKQKMLAREISILPDE